MPPQVAVIERTGSLVGFGDPFAAISNSVFTATAVNKAEVLVFERRVLWQMLLMCGHEQALAMATTIEAEYNKLMDRMKAKEYKLHNVTPPPGSTQPKPAAADVLTNHADFRHSDNVRALEAQVSQLEERLLKRCVARVTHVTYVTYVTDET